MLGLTGRKVLVTRTQEDSEPLVSLLETAGAQAVVLPCISIEHFADDITRARLAAAFARATWVAFTSRRGVDVTSFLETEIRHSTRIAAVGEGTAGRVVSCFGRCELIATEGTGSSLGRDLVEQIQQAPDFENAFVVVPGSEIGRKDLESQLANAGIKFVSIPVYRTHPVEAPTELLDLTVLGIDTVILASPSAATGLLNQARIPAGIKIITIGPSTSEAVRDAGLTVAAEAAARSAEALLEVLK